MRKHHSLTQAFALWFLVFTMAPAWSAPPQTLEPDELASLLEKAETREEHLKLATHYEAEEEQFRKEAEQHRTMASRYERRSKALPPKIASLQRGMPRHCRTLAQSLENAAKAAEQLAEAHRSMADRLGQALSRPERPAAKL